jgi:REP-associated tyrosine transposase
MRYIELNPVRARLVPRPGEYRWSSFRANATGEEDALLTPHSSYACLARSAALRQAAYLALFQNGAARRGARKRARRRAAPGSVPR